jgi:hypothetical protein
MIYKEITKSEFCNNERLCRNFSYKGLSALYDWLDNEGYELDEVALCCEFAEWKINETFEAYGLENIEELEKETTVVFSDDSIVIFMQF